MPFVSQMPRPFTRLDVEALRMNQNGVYGLLGQNEYVYIGKGDIRQRLIDHLNGDNPCINRRRPSHWVAEVVAGDPSTREQQLILEYNPTCNLRVG